MMRMLLESLDHEVLDAPDGAAGVELIEKVKPDFALIDIGLPTMTGYEVAQQIRSNKDLKRIMLIALTGYGTAGDVSAAHSAGFDAHLVKPADFSKAPRAARRPQRRRLARPSASCARSAES